MQLPSFRDGADHAMDAEQDALKKPDLPGVFVRRSGAILRLTGFDREARI